MKANKKSRMYEKGYQNTIHFAYIPDFKNQQEKIDFEAGLKEGYARKKRNNPPLKVLAIYDKPEYADRYTVYFNVIEKDRPRMYMCLGMDAHPFAPQGIGQHSAGMLGPHNGKRISFRQLPPDCKKAVLMHLKEKNDPPRLNPLAEGHYGTFSGFCLLDGKKSPYTEYYYESKNKVYAVIVIGSMKAYTINQKKSDYTMIHKLIENRYRI